MAFHFINFPKYSTNGIIFMRLVRYLINRNKCAQFSSSQILNEAGIKNDSIKYTTSKAAEVPIKRAIGLETAQSNNRPKYQQHVVVASVAVFLLYFSFLREENDIDEFLKGKQKSSEHQLLKYHLKYCEKNNLPVAALKAKLRELEGNENHLPFK